MINLLLACQKALSKLKSSFSTNILPFQCDNTPARPKMDCQVGKIVYLLKLSGFVPFTVERTGDSLKRKCVYSKKSWAFVYFICLLIVNLADFGFYSWCLIYGFTHASIGSVVPYISISSPVITTTVNNFIFLQVSLWL